MKRQQRPLYRKKVKFTLIQKTGLTMTQGALRATSTPTSWIDSSLLVHRERVRISSAEAPLRVMCNSSTLWASTAKLTFLYASLTRCTVWIKLQWWRPNLSFQRKTMSSIWASRKSQKASSRGNGHPAWLKPKNSCLKTLTQLTSFRISASIRLQILSKKI